MIIDTYIQRAIGYTLTGVTRERCMFIAHGGGTNGKSTLLNILYALTGDYGRSVETDTLMVKANPGISTDIARLNGARYVFATEGEEGKRLAEASIKRLTGNDVMTARFLYGREFDFRPECKIWFGTNHRPIVRGTDNAIWNRLKLIPFTVTIPDDRIDRDLEAKLLAELPGILAWAVEGCRMWQRDGLTTPTAVADATTTYRSEMDVIATWLDEQCDMGDNNAVGAQSLYTNYKNWCEANGERPMSAKPFKEQMRDRGFTQHKTNINNQWRGLALKGDPLNLYVLRNPNATVDLNDAGNRAG